MTERTIRLGEPDDLLAWAAEEIRRLGVTTDALVQPGHAIGHRHRTVAETIEYAVRERARREAEAQMARGRVIPFLGRRRGAA